jgi:hypothetical protein
MGGIVGDIVKGVTGGAVDLDKAKDEAERALAKANEEATKLAKAVGEAAKATAEHAKAATESAIAAEKTLALLPFVILRAAATNKPDDIRDAVAELVRVSSDGAAAASLAASQPYFLAADLSKNDGGDGAKLLRGAIAGELVKINIVPALLKQIGRLDAQTPEKIAAAIAIAPLSAVLAAYLEASHDALEPHAKPMPALVRNALRSFFKVDLLAKVRYIASPLGLTLPEVINGYQVFMGNHAHAVTVGNLIAFSVEPGTSDDDVFWWAHEACHVEQYEKLAIDGFAKAYIEDYKDIEQEAESRAAAVRDALAMP